ncbi:uncharacterized protein FIESC28_04736 [Fusarium coffeatum]|uniref:Uncharacterized protein n=1 Tax=Fusarium coffeatum TaxID=231269 RepID=A0A366RXT4_9HYPO|nr:uncharacterized protein FIESC28_04736 [Fusarium coffeatum]RBR21893.1 hypothetical protein FIESC28_04736 [Fusarium coffeatum]
MDTTSNHPHGISSLAITDSLPSNSRPLTQNNASSMCLEELPYDVRHLILFLVPTIADLLALVRASPVFYRDYAIEPEKWLYHCLGLELGHTIIDAISVHLANTFASRQHHVLDETQRTLEDMRHFISTYLSRVLSPIDHNSALADKADIVSIVAFHCTVVMPLVSRFMEWTQGNFEGLSLSGGLSHTEMKRILRGFYRYQLFCKVFGVKGRPEQHIQPYVSEDEKLELFLGIYEPWETEEVLCVYDFVNDEYDRLLENTWWDVVLIEPRLSPGMSIDEVNLAKFLESHASQRDASQRVQNDCLKAQSREIYKTGLGSLGLIVLVDMFNAADHETLVSLVAQHIELLWDPWIEETVSTQCQARRRNWVFSARDRAELERAPMPFTGDSEGSPPLAWVTIWKGTSSNRFGQWIPRLFREWGYVMWDSGRMITAGGIAALEEKWVETYTLPDSDFFVDPRERA